MFAQAWLASPSIVGVALAIAFYVAVLPLRRPALIAGAPLFIMLTAPLATAGFFAAAFYALARRLMS